MVDQILIFIILFLHAVYAAAQLLVQSAKAALLFGQFQPQFGYLHHFSCFGNRFVGKILGHILNFVQSHG